MDDYAPRRKSERNARRPISSAKARAKSMGVRSDLAALGLRPIAFIAPIPIIPTPIPGPIIASIAIPFARAIKADVSINKKIRKINEIPENQVKGTEVPSHQTFSESRIPLIL